MSITSEIEEKFGLSIEKLRPAEKQTYFAMEKAVQESQMTPEKLREYISMMIDAVQKELVDEPEFIRFLCFKFENRKQIYLKARLKNYILLNSFLQSPQKAKEQLENMISGMAKKKYGV